MRLSLTDHDGNVRILVWLFLFCIPVMVLALVVCTTMVHVYQYQDGLTWYYIAGRSWKHACQFWAATGIGYAGIAVGWNYFNLVCWGIEKYDS